jgi:hypothetical protein
VIEEERSRMSDVDLGREPRREGGIGRLVKRYQTTAKLPKKINPIPMSVGTISCAIFPSSLPVTLLALTLVVTVCTPPPVPPPACPYALYAREESSEKNRNPLRLELESAGVGREEEARYGSFHDGVDDSDSSRGVSGGWACPSGLGGDVRVNVGFLESVGRLGRRGRWT